MRVERKMGGFCFLEDALYCRMLCIVCRCSERLGGDGSGENG